MRKHMLLSLILLLSAISGIGQNGTYSDQLILKNINNSFIAFKKDNLKTPFTGYVIDIDADSLLELKSFYNEGILYKTESYYQNGKVHRVINYDINGAESGDYIEYDDKGNISCKGEMKEGEKHGFWNFYKEGKRFEFGLYQFDQRSGTWKVDSTLNGNFKKVFYDKGTLIKDYIKTVD